MTKLKKCRECTHRLMCKIYHDVYDAIAKRPILIHIDIDFIDELAMSCSEYQEKQHDNDLEKVKQNLQKICNYYETLGEGDLDREEIADLFDELHAIINQKELGICSEVTVKHDKNKSN